MPFIQVSSVIFMPMLSLLYFTCHINFEIISGLLFACINFRSMDKIQPVLLTHGDSIEKVADSFKAVAMSQAFIAGIANDKLRLYGVQFHPEVELTSNGKTMLKNFLVDIAGLTGNYTMQSREIECINGIKEVVGNNKVLVEYFIINLQNFLRHYYNNN